MFNKTERITAKRIYRLEQWNGETDLLPLASIGAVRTNGGAEAMAVPPNAPGAQPTVRMSRCRQLEVPAACSRSLALGERLGCCCRALPAPSHDTCAVRTTNAGSSAQSSGWDILRRDFQTRGIVSIFANNHEEDHVPFWKRVEAASAASHREPPLGDRLRTIPVARAASTVCSAGVCSVA